MKIALFDYSGHPGQIQLSRELAARGHQVLHLHCPEYQSGKGDLSDRGVDVSRGGSLRIAEVTLGSDFARYQTSRRIGQEVRYGLLGAAAILDFAPDVALLSNVPLLGHAVLAQRLSLAKVPMVFWQQDIYSRAIGDAARRKLRGIGGMIAKTADAVERRIALQSAHTVAISAAFLPTLRRWHVAEDRRTVIENWGPLADVTPTSKDNGWAAQHGLDGHPLALYSGTLGLKHDPSLLYEMAQQLAEHLPQARLVVVSQGQGRQWLERRLTEQPLQQLVLLDYQPYEQLPAMLGSADVLIAVLEPEAGAFSVPSKVLPYLCSGRAVLGVMPLENQAAAMIAAAGAGWAVAPEERVQSSAILVQALSDRAATAEAGSRARRYAERNFSIEHIAARFERILADACGARTVEFRSEAAPPIARAA